MDESTIREKLSRIKCFMLDMDGTFYLGANLLDGSLDFMEKLRETGRTNLFLTNNSSKSAEVYRQKLARMGLDVPEEHFYTSALATAAFLADQAPGCSVYALGEAGLLNALYDRGITSEFAPMSFAPFQTRFVAFVSVSSE